MQRFCAQLQADHPVNAFPLVVLVDDSELIDVLRAEAGNERVFVQSWGYWKLDFIAAENSMGFHNPEEALRILAAATNMARQSELKAVQAAGTPDVIQPETN